MQELNKAFCKFKYGYTYQKSVKDPAGIFAWNTPVLAVAYVACTALAGYALLVKRYNILWIAGPYVPFWSIVLYNYARQPHQQIENCYKYILAKRAATCEYELNKSRFA